MQRRILLSILTAPAAAGLLLAGLSPAYSATIPQEEAYVIVDADDAVQVGSATFYPTGPIDDDTLVIIAEPDGTLPGISKAELASLKGGNTAATASRLGFESTGVGTFTPIEDQVAALAASKPHTYTAVNSTSWTLDDESSSIIGSSASATVYYIFNAAQFTSQRNAGLGLGYYRGYNGSQFGTWSKWYSLGSGTFAVNGGAAVPWGNTAAVSRFQAKCAASLACGGNWGP